MENIKAEFEKLTESNNQTDLSKSEVGKEIYVDDNRLNDKNYYGELNKKNPYLK